MIEYCSVVYHSLLKLEEENTLEKLHRLAVTICFEFHRPTDKTMAEEEIEDLKARRLGRRDSFLRKAPTNPRDSRKWFPPREVRSGLWRPWHIITT